MAFELLKEVLLSSDKIALSTALENVADVKIVNFVWFPEQLDTLYFSSVAGTAALDIYAQNPDAAFITVPFDDQTTNPYVRGAHVKIQKSTKKMTDILPRYLELVPNYQHVYDLIGDKLVVFELKLGTIYVDAGLGRDKQTIDF